MNFSVLFFNERSSHIERHIETVQIRADILARTILEGLADEDVDAPALFSKGYVHMGIDVLFGKEEEAKTGASIGKELSPLEGVIVAEDLVMGKTSGADWQ